MTLNKSKVRLCMPLTKGAYGERGVPDGSGPDGKGPANGKGKGRKAILNVAGSVGERPQDEAVIAPKKGHEERMALARMAMCRRGKGK